MPAFEVRRSVRTTAPASAVQPLVADFHAWQRWSPWEGVDPDLRRTYTGPESGVGAAYAWEGNRKAGAGSMRVTGCEEDTVEVELAFLKPMRQTNQVRFTFVPAGDGGTEVTWSMSGTTTGVWGVLSRVFPMDKVVGKDFERGLAALAAEAERS